MAGRTNVSVLDGYFLGEVPRCEDDISDNDDISDEDEFVDFSDNNIFSPKSTHVESSSLKNQNVQFTEYRSGKTFHIEGALHFCEPWWAATLQVRRGHGNKKRLVGFPAYRLRTDPGVIRDKVILLLMAACEVDPQHMEIFTQYLRSHGLENQLDFEHFPRLLEQFGETSEDNADIMQCIKTSTQMGPGMFVFKSIGMEDFFQYVPQLLPRRFKKFLEKGEDLIPELQMTLRTEPWAFGFAAILANNLKLFGCEAPLQNFYNSGLINKFPPDVKDAIHIYDVLKLLSRRYGHTYTFEDWLPKCNQFKNYKVTNWPAALKYLEDNAIVVREGKSEGPKGSAKKIYLTKLWNAEDSIAKGICTLFKRHKLDPWAMDIDLSKPRFSSLQTDSDQMNAATLISREPIVVLSGKGGCGKTTVVSSVFEYADELLKSQNHQNYQDQMFADAEVDDFTLTQSAQHIEKTLFVSRDDEDDKDDSQAATAAGNDHSYQETQSSEVTIGTEDEPSDILGPEDDNEDDEQEEEKPLVLLTAPTGKAANLLGKRSNLPSFTLHQVIFSYWNWRRGGSKFKDQFIRASEEWKFSEVQALVVDECSLVSVSTFNTLFSALLSSGKLRKVVLLGDVNQLPSIEPGNFLSNMYHSLSRWGCSAMLTHNHRSESELIIENATLISQQMIPKVDSKRSFHQINLDELGRGIDPDSSMDDLGIDQDTAIRNLLKCQNPSIGDDKTSQFVAFRRRDCDAINEICCQHYSNHPTMSHRRTKMFQVGDKVCCCKNAQVKDELTGKDIRLCNGEIFFIKHDLTKSDEKPEKRLLTLEVDSKKKEEKKQIQVNFRTLKYSCKMKHAWARTIHTYQGSESDTVVYVVGSPGGQTWQHVYTAVTRGRKQVILITRKSNLEKAVSNLPLKRFTSLQDKLCEALEEFQPPKATPGPSQKYSGPSTPLKQMPHSRNHGNHSPGSASGSARKQVTNTSNPSPFQPFSKQHTLAKGISHHNGDAVSRSYCNGDPGPRLYLNGDPGSRSYRNGDQCSRSYLNGDPGSRSYHNGDPGSRSYLNGDSGSRSYYNGNPEHNSCFTRASALLNATVPPDGKSHSSTVKQTDLGKKDEEDSQAFSDWGDDVVDNITQLESDLNISASCRDIGRESPLSVNIAIPDSIAEKRTAVLKESGNQLFPTDVKEDTDDHLRGHLKSSGDQDSANDSVLDDFFQNSFSTRHSKLTTSEAKDVGKSAGLDERSEHKRRLDFGTESNNDDELDDLLSDLVPVTSRSCRGHATQTKSGKSNQAVESIHQINPNQGQEIVKDREFGHESSPDIQHVREGSTSSGVTASPKRTFDSDWVTSNKRRLSHQPITNSDVSPLRRELLNIGLSSK